MNKKFTRRQALLAVSSALLLPAACSQSVARFSQSSVIFSHGVASGDPDRTSVVIWTRVSDSEDAVDVDWTMASDSDFLDVVARGRYSTDRGRDHTVKIVVDNLDPGQEYYYQFAAKGSISPTGRTRTLPVGHVEQLVVAVATCSNYPFGYFNAYEVIANDPSIDLVVHLGDYIYESAEHDQDAVRHHTGPEIQTLQQYRDRYIQYRSDPALQAAHAATAWVVTLDDHEVDNDWADDSTEDDQSPEQFLLRRAAAFQAYFEFMPLRQASMPSGPNIQLYRRLRFGNLMEMSILDTRQYRSNQPCLGRNSPSCPTHISPDQSILGTNQREWLFEGLTRSEARWNVLSQQVMVARLLGTDDEGQETWSMDKWDGCSRARSGSFYSP